MFVLRNALRAIFAALFVSLILFSSAYAQKWAKLAPFPQPAEELMGVAAGGKMYVFGGLGPGWTPEGMVYEYDPASDQWTKKNNMPLLSHHIALVEYRSKIYVMGGFTKPATGPTAWVPIDNAWEYDPAADTWKALAPMPTKRGSPVAAMVSNKIYVIGGASTIPGSKETAVHPLRPHMSVGTVEEYDPATNTWHQRAAMPTPRNHAVAGVVGGKIYVIGGRVGAAYVGGGADASSNVGVTEAYDPATDTWGAPLRRMPTARSAGAAGVYGGRIYVTGGEYQDYVMMATTRSFEAFDPATNTWQTLPSLPVPRHGLAAAVVGKRLHFVSGDVQSAGSGVRVHTPSHDTFEFP